MVIEHKSESHVAFIGYSESISHHLVGLPISDSLEMALQPQNYVFPPHIIQQSFDTDMVARIPIPIASGTQQGRLLSPFLIHHCL